MASTRAPFEASLSASANGAAREDGGVALLAVLQRRQQIVAFGLAALALADAPGEDADPRGGRVDACLVPLAGDVGDVLDEGEPAELGRLADGDAERRVAQARAHVPDAPAEKLVARPALKAQAGLVQMRIAILPVEGDERLVDLLEQDLLPGVAVVAGAGDRRLQLAGPRAGRRRAQHVALDGAHLEPAVAAQPQVVHEPGDEVEAATRGRLRIGLPPRVERGQVEAVAAVLYLGDQMTALEEEHDVELVAGAAVTYRVGHGLLDGQHDGVDRLGVGDVLVQVVAHTVAGAQQAGRVEGQAERQTRRACRVGGHG